MYCITCNWLVSSAESPQRLILLLLLFLYPCQTPAYIVRPSRGVPVYSPSSIHKRMARLGSRLYRPTDMVRHPSHSK